MEQFKNKVAIVTGGGSGIGQALCQELGQRGSMVVVASLHDDHAKRAASSIVQNGGHAHAVQVDVSREEEVRRLIDETVSEYGRLDYLFNNAGISIGGDARDLTFRQINPVIKSAASERVNAGAVYQAEIRRLRLLPLIFSYGIKWFLKDCCSGRCVNILAVPLSSL